MKTLTTLFATAIAVTFSINANAGGMNDVSEEYSHPADFKQAIQKQDVSLTKGQEPWRLGNELSFNSPSLNTATVLQEIESNPTASGGGATLNWDGVLNEY
jgi:hypothetical protein